MTAYEIENRRNYIAEKSNAQINKAANILWSRYLEKPCGFKSADFERAAFAAYFGGGYVLSDLEKEGYSLREIVLAIAGAANGLVREWIANKKAASK